MMTIHGQLTEQDYLQAQQLHMQLSGWARSLPYVALALWVVDLILVGFKASQGRPGFLLALLPVTLFFLFIRLLPRFLLPRQAKRLFRQNQEISAPLAMEFSENGMKFTNSFGHNERSWSHFVKWKEDEQALLLYHSDQIFNLIPKRLLAEADDLSFVRERLQKHQIPVAGTSSQVLSTQVGAMMILLSPVISIVIDGMG